MNQNNGRLPIEDEVDVISVGTSFLRFLDIAEKIKKPVVIVTDNDGNYKKNVKEKYESYKKIQTIKISASENDELETLEPQIVEANKDHLDSMRKILKINKKRYPDKKSIINYMVNNKTSYALKIFNNSLNIIFPPYILDAINWEYEKE